jgi:hypothetical protein
MRACLFLLFNFFFIYCYADAPLTILGNGTGCPGTYVTSSLTVNNFSNISSISLRIDYNPSFLSYDTAINFNSQLDGLLVNNVNISSGLSKIMITWSNVDSVSLANGAKILDLVFVIISGSSGLTFNNLSNNGADCEYANGNGDALIDTPTESYYSNGSISEPVAIGGNVSGSKMILIGQNTGNMQLSGNLGDVVTWQKQYHEDPYEDIPGTSGLQTYSEVPVYTGTWHYRALVQFGSCSQQYSSAAEINVIMTPGGTRTWTGLVSDDWIHPGNWNPGGIPGETDNIIIPSGITTMPQIKNNGLSCLSLEISEGAILTIISGAGLQQIAWHCGNPLAINHVAGLVAPVDKIVIYGTVTNIPGGPSNCWITSNLGADHQAIAVNDATEASAGWYWQFNKQQGYKHDGGTRTPNTTWISGISENSNWIAVNDPCSIELGDGWRIPTITEWTNAATAGGWTNWNGPWNSALKMHASGYLEYYNGLLSFRGSFGSYWSSSQNSNSNGWNMDFNISSINITEDTKAYGVNSRCLIEQVATELPAVTTAGVTNITSATAIGGGNVTFDGGGSVTARGVCWNTSPNPTIADDHTTDDSGTGAFASSLNTLNPNTLYYVRAYVTNSVGSAYGNEVSFTTLPSLYCGDSFTILHSVSHGVAPVEKTVTYETVTNIPGEPSKCWITSNLGADQQATAVNDATEASAGWYWQFNRQQGYKHDGGTRTPNTTWISGFNENSNWISSYDPCTKELGNGWRIPTSTEWTNVDAIGDWTDWNGPWYSALKLHAGGYLEYYNGSLFGRGLGTDFWSSSQYDNSTGVHLLFNGGTCYIEHLQKSYAFTIRCISEQAAMGLPTVTTTVVTYVTQGTAVSGGNVTSGGGGSVTARGVCWNTSSNPTTVNDHTSDGSGTGAFASSLNTLNPNTLYYVRAYATNSVGTAYGNEVNFTTQSSLSCGDSFTILHSISHEVAPVEKTVTYETVTNIPGEPSKCWITSNLGADHEATAVNDAMEASAGWYWQFNSQQGYKHDGGTRTPNTAWVSGISENSNWVGSKDPCTIELGSQWRIPTLTEWTNVNVAGGWIDWNGPWNSALKMHAGGYLEYSNGSLNLRGSLGSYWSSSQISYSNGWNLDFTNVHFSMTSLTKACGLNTRCISDLTATGLPTVTTVDVTNITPFTAISGGNITLGGGGAVNAKGVCFSTSSNPTTADNHTTDGSGTGFFASSLNTLNPNTLYYLRAYATNDIGTAYGNEVSFITPSSLLCGESFTIFHSLSHGVAPAEKTVIYGTVTNIPGENSKCWITCNLGADHQANAVNDASEASAGWYWQFNRQQGYKHDGGTRTPNTAWISGISENSNWIATNDPCTIELGNGWHIPTSTEWTNVDDAGGWTDWTGPWFSALKLHGAGYLEYYDGSLTGRGLGTDYWSSTENDNSHGYQLISNSGSCFIRGDYKSYAFPIRCLRE